MNNRQRFVLDARTATPHFPGIGRYVRSLANALAPLLERSEELVLLTDSAQPLQLHGVPSVPIAASPFSIAQQWRIPPAIHKVRGALYHSPYYLMPYRPGAPTVLTVYDVIPLRYPQFSSARSRLFFCLATRLALHAASHVIAITENARQDFIVEFGLPPERITAVPLAADPVFQPQSSAQVEAVREKHQLSGRFVLYLGSNKPHKNLISLVSAWQELAQARGLKDAGLGAAELVIAGAWDPRYPEARQAADGMGNVRIRWLGPVSDVDLPALYTAATVFVFPSLYEGFGLPVIEAMACGTPVICSNVTALSEVTGGGAMLIDPSDTSTLANELRRLLCDEGLRSELRERGLARAGQFSWERTAAETLTIYRGLCRKL